MSEGERKGCGLLVNLLTRVNSSSHPSFLFPLPSGWDLKVHWKWTRYRVQPSKNPAVPTHWKKVPGTGNEFGLGVGVGVTAPTVPTPFHNSSFFLALFSYPLPYSRIQESHANMKLKIEWHSRFQIEKERGRRERWHDGMLTLANFLEVARKRHSYHAPSTLFLQGGLGSCMKVATSSPRMGIELVPRG